MKKYYKRILSAFMVCCMIFSLIHMYSEAFEYTYESASGSTYIVDAMYATFDNVQFEQTKARSMLKLVNNFRTGSEAWAYDVSGNKKVYSGLSKLQYDYNLEQVAMNLLGEVIADFSHESLGQDISWFEKEDAATAKAENLAFSEPVMGMDQMKTAEYGLSLLKEENETYAHQGHRRVIYRCQSA